VVIEDDALVLDSVGGMLRSWGCRVLTADSLDAASSALEGEHAAPLCPSYAGRDLRKVRRWSVSESRKQSHGHGYLITSTSLRFGSC
jgi:hypothetical protein